jgi:predicted GIY-YIG superfamily endonuclease
MHFVCMLRCADGSLYVRHTNDLPARLEAHNNGTASDWTAVRRPVQLVHSEACPSQAEAVARERQLKRWSRQKKAALISGDVSRLRALSKRRGP